MVCWSGWHRLSIWMSRSVRRSSAVEVTELILLFCHVIHGRRAAPPPSATSPLVAKAVASTCRRTPLDPQLNVAQLARYTYTSREHLSRVFKEYTSRASTAI